MDAHEILFRINSLALPTDQFIVTGSSPLAMVGLRDALDIDLFVTPTLYSILESRGWQTVTKSDSNRPGLVFDVFEAHYQWMFNNYKASFAEEYREAVVIDGIAFVNLPQTKIWKSALGRTKDTNDIKLIDDYLAKQH